VKMFGFLSKLFNSTPTKPNKKSRTNYKTKQTKKSKTSSFSSSITKTSPVIFDETLLFLQKSLFVSTIVTQSKETFTFIKPIPKPLSLDLVETKDTPKPHYFNGIHDTLKRNYYPDYNYDQALEKYNESKQVPSETHNFKFQFPNITALLPSKHDGGSKTGRFVDQQITSLFNNKPGFIVQHSTTSPKPWENAVSDVNKYIQAGICAVAFRQLLNMVNHEVILTYIHPLTRMILEFMYQQGYASVRAQVPVASNDWNLATAVDMLWWKHETKSLIIVELKKCKSFYYNLANNKLKPPFENYDNSPRFQHQLQLCATEILYNNTFYEDSEKRVSGAMVVRVDHEGIEIYPEDRNIFNKLFHVLRT